MMLRFAVFAVVLALGTTFGASSHARELPDVLDMPAAETARSINSLMTDIAKAGNRLVAVGEYGFVLYSDDHGETWQQAQVPVQATLTSVTFISDKKGWAVGHDAVILVTEDGGASWSKQLDGRSTGEKLLAAAKAWQQRVQAQLDAGEGDEDALMMQLDAADMAADEAQREIEVGPNRPFMDIYFRNEKEGFAVGAFGYFFTTTDGGETWQDSSPSIPNPDVLNLYSITELANDTMLLVGEFGLVLRSTDAGQSWQPVDIGYGGTLFGVYGEQDDARSLIIGLRGSAFYSDDLGESWRRINTGTQASLLGMQVFQNEDILVVGLGGTMLRGKPGEDLRILNKTNTAHLSAVAVADENTLVTTGMNGIVRMTIDGEILNSSYQVGVAK